MTPTALSAPDPDPRRRISPSSPPPDAADAQVEPLLTAASETLVEEFSAFYRTAVPRLVAFLRWHGAPLPDAADCAQEALTICFQQWSTIAHRYAWCRIVAARLYARHVASTVEHPTAELDTSGSPLLAPNTDIDAVEHRHTILALLDKLPMRQRQVLAWTYDGATPTEIAEALRISPDSVRANLHHARTTLRARRDRLGVDR